MVESLTCGTFAGFLVILPPSFGFTFLPPGLLCCFCFLPCGTFAVLVWYSFHVHLFHYILFCLVVLFLLQFFGLWRFPSCSTLVLLLCIFSTVNEVLLFFPYCSHACFLFVLMHVKFSFFCVFGPFAVVHSLLSGKVLTFASCYWCFLGKSWLFVWCFCCSHGCLLFVLMHVCFSFLSVIHFKLQNQCSTFLWFEVFSCKFYK